MGALRGGHVAIYAETFYNMSARIRTGDDTVGDRAERDSLVAAMAAPLAALTLTLDPDIIALGGELGRYAAELAPAIALALPDLARGGPALEPQIVGASFVDEGILVGAIDQAFALHSVLIYGVAGITPPTQILLTDRAWVGADA